MSFDKVLGQELAKEALGNMIIKERIPHSLIFTGHDGVGKSIMAREFSKVLLCKKDIGKEKKPKKFAILKKEKEVPSSCGACSSCKRIERDVHPDVNFVKPSQEKKGIGVDKIRELEKMMYFKPIEANFKILILKEADSMINSSKQAAANAFLKTLEEPPQGSIIILLTSKIERFPQTITSRCQIIRFLPIEESLIKQKLMEEFEIGENEAGFISKMSFGSIGKAITMLRDKTLEKKNWIIDLLIDRDSKDGFAIASEILGEINSKGKGAEEKRRFLVDILSFLTLFYRDILTIREGLHSKIYNIDRLDLLEELKNSYSFSLLRKNIETIRKAQLNIRQNANMRILLENLVVSLT